MIQIRRAEERGASRSEWLESRFTFSFADYYDPDQLGFRALRVLNDDRISPASGFGSHSHKDMEILTYPIAGVLEHRDSEGNTSRLTSGRIQLMTAGTGIVHSEKNPSPDAQLHLLQIWILPNQSDLAPGYQEKEIHRDRTPLEPLVTPSGRDDTLQIHQDVEVYRVRLRAGGSVEYPIASGRHAWLQIISGTVALNGTELSDADGAAVSDESMLRFEAGGDVEALLFDLA